MGIFSSKTKHFVDTAVIRVVEDAMVPDILATAVAESIFGGADISTSILEGALNGSYLKIERAYRYAESGDYFYGLPDARILSSQVSSDQVTGILRDKHGLTAQDALDVEFVHFRPLNNFFMGWQYLRETYDFDVSRNSYVSIAATTDTPEVRVYLEKMVAHHQAVQGLEPERTALGSFDKGSKEGELPSPAYSIYADDLSDWVPQEEVLIGPNQTEGVTLHLIQANLDGTVTRFTKFVDLSAYDTDREYFHVKYYIGSGSTLAADPSYWLYDTASNDYPTLNNLYLQADYASTGSYFPFIVFRSDGENRGNPVLKDTEQYKTTTKLCQMMGFDFQEMCDSVHENPDVEDVRQAVMMMAVPITSDDPVDIEYLMDYFKAVKAQMPDTTRPAYDKLAAATDYSGADSDSYVLEISDADFVLRVSFDGIETRLRSGDIGPPGTFENSETVIDLQEDLGEHLLVKIQGNLNAQLNGGKTRVLRKQLIPGIYEEVLVKNPQFRYEIYKNKGSEGGFDDERMLIPVDMSLVDAWNPIQREKLYFRSLQFVANSHIKQKVPWYASGWFKVVVIIIAVVISMWDGGFTLQGVMAALAAGGTTALAMSLIIVGYIVNVVVIGKLIELAAGKVADVFGKEVATILAIAAIVYGAYNGFTNSADTLLNLTPENYLAAAGNLYNAALMKEGEGLAIQAQRLAEYKEDLLEELDAQADLLGDPLNIDPLLFTNYLQPVLIPGEGPERFYNRTYYNDNPGIDAIDFVQNFVEISLRLPEVS